MSEQPYDTNYSIVEERQRRYTGRMGWLPLKPEHFSESSVFVFGAYVLHQEVSIAHIDLKTRAVAKVTIEWEPVQIIELAQEGRS